MPKPITQLPPATVLQEAQSLVFGARGDNYGHPRDDYGRTVAAFNALTGHRLTPSDGILFMVLVKFSRHRHQPKRDNLVDAAGYVECMARAEGIDP